MSGDTDNGALQARRPSVKALRRLAPKLGVSVHWLETGEDDPAIELAHLVLDQGDQRLPRKTRVLAQRVLDDTR